MRKDDNEKELYRLWWEYLKRSDNYKKFCKWITRKRKTKIPVPKKFQKKENGSAPKEIFTYMHFGNVHTCNFEEFWRLHKERLIYTENHRSPKGIEDYTELISRDMDVCIESFIRHEGRELTLQEFKDSFLKMLTEGMLRPFLFLMVDVADRTPEELLSQFEKFVRRKKKDPHVKKMELTIRKNVKPSQSYKRYDELKLYLEVYDLHIQKGYNTEKIIEKLTGENIKELKSKVGYDSTERKYNMYYEKARRIIENVERGFFPGKY